ncbi:MAG: hypothetical protein WBQ30_16115, partial [Thermoanaerobaculia bacterium]
MEQAGEPAGTVLLEQRQDLLLVELLNCAQIAAFDVELEEAQVHGEVSLLFPHPDLGATFLEMHLVHELIDEVD